MRFAAFYGIIPGFLRVLAFEKITEHQHHQHEIDVNKHNDNIQAFALTKDTPVNMIAFALFRDLLRAKMGFDLLRVKGIINVQNMDRPMVIHGVQHVFHPPEILPEWPSDDHRTRLVVIAQDLDHQEISACFAALGMHSAAQCLSPASPVADQ